MHSLQSHSSSCKMYHSVERKFFECFARVAYMPWGIRMICVLSPMKLHTVKHVCGNHQSFFFNPCSLNGCGESSFVERNSHKGNIPFLLWFECVGGKFHLHLSVANHFLHHSG